MAGTAHGDTVLRGPQLIKMSALLPADETDAIIVDAGAPAPGAGYTWTDTHFNEVRCKLLTSVRIFM